MSFFYDLNKKLDSIRATPEVTHQQLNERNMSQHAKGIKKYTKPGMEKLSKLGREGASKAKMDATRKEFNQYDNNDKVNEMWGDPYHDDAKVDAINAANPPKASGTGTKPATPVKHHTYDRKSVASNISGEESAKYDYRGQVEEGPMNAVKKISKKVASGINKLVGHGSDEDMIKDVQRKAGVPATGKKPNFADKIANAKKEVDEMLGDVAAEAMRKALGGGKGRNAAMDEDNAFDYKSPRKDAPKVGSIERGHKHDIKHSTSDPRYTGRTVTRRTDDQGISVGADDDSAASGEKRGRGRPKGTKGAIGAKGPSGKSKLMTKEGADQGQAQQIVDDLAELRAAAKQAQRGGEFPQGFASKLEVVLYAAMTLIKNQQPGDAQVREEEKTSTRDDRAEKAGKKVTKDIEYDEENEDNIHGKKRGPEDAKAEKAGKKVAKDIEHDEKKKEKEVDESTTSGSVATSTATKGSKGSMIGKGIYDSMNRELENMIAESMSINMSDSTEGNKSLTVTATDDDAMKLAMMLKSAGLGGQGRELQGDHSHGEEACDTCGMQDCGCGDVHEAVDENSPDWPTNTETSPDALQYSGGLNKPKTDVAGDGQTTIPNSAVHTQDEDALRRMMEMAGLAEAAKPDFLDLDKDKNTKEPMKDAAADADEEEDTVKESIRRMMEIAGVKKTPMDEQKTEEGNLFTAGLEDDDVKIGDKIPGTNAIKKKDIDESIFALNNQWRAYKG